MSKNIAQLGKLKIGCDAKIFPFGTLYYKLFSVQELWWRITDSNR